MSEDTKGLRPRPSLATVRYSSTAIFLPGHVWNKRGRLLETTPQTVISLWPETTVTLRRRCKYDDDYARHPETPSL